MKSHDKNMPAHNKLVHMRVPLHYIVYLIFCCGVSMSVNAQANNTGNVYISGNVYLAASFTNASTASYQNDGSFTLTGDFTNNQSSMTEGTGTTSFTGSSLQNISGTQSPVFHHVLWNNSSGVQMNINTTMGGDISPVSGSLYFNGYALTMGGKMSTSYTNVDAFNVTTSSDLNIIGAAASGNGLYFASIANTLHNLTVSSGGTGYLGNALNIVAGSSYGTVVVDGTFNASGYLTLKSDANGDARVGSSSGTITGNATVERYIPARRAWRFITVPFSSSTQTINQAWQEGNTNTNLNCPAQYPGTPGYGTDITWNGVNGYDLNTTQNPSIKVWSNNAWAPVSSTLTPLITDYPAYCLFVRGDRTICLIQATAAIPTNTVLRATGVLNQTGGVNSVVKSYSGTAGNMFFIANPYATPINLTNVITGGRVNGFDANKVWVWDPTLGGTYGVGAYVTYSNGIWAPSGGSYAGGSSNQPILQSAQGFMVQTNSSTASVTFREADKANTEGNVWGITANKTYPAVFVNLMSSDGTTVLDGVAAGFSNKFSADVDANDAKKQWNDNENLALVRGTKTLAIEFRPNPKQDDTLFFRLYIRQLPYKFQITSSNLISLPGTAWIVDKYLNTETEINLLDTTLFSFTPNPDTNSYRNRFMLVFKRNEKRAGHQSIDEMAKTMEPQAEIYPNPVTNGKVNLALRNLTEGNYVINIYSTEGKLALTRKINFQTGKTNYSINLPPGIATGIYSLQVLSKEGTVVQTTSLVIGKN